MQGLIKYGTLFIILLFVSTVVLSQDLTKSRRSSYVTLIYTLNNEQAGILHKDIWDFETSFLTNLYDSYPSDSAYQKDLPLGHYLFVKTVDGRLSIELKSVNNISIHILNNHRDLMLVFNDSTGTALTDVMVHIGSRKIKYSKSVNAYRIATSNKQGFVQVAHQGHVSYFKIERRYNNTFFVRTGKKIIGTFPVNFILSPFLYSTRTVSNLIKGYGVSPPRIYYRAKNLFVPKPHTGYIAFNKPIYKPGDTVKLKAFITTRKGKPIRKPVDAFLRNYYSSSVNKKIGTVQPFSKGAYHLEIPLQDSLQLTLDNDYSIEFESKKGHSLLSSNFRYEEYELKQNNYSLRTDNTLKHKGGILFLKGEDSNEMPLYDTRAEIVIRTEKVKNYYGNQLFIPDTLWFHKIKLEPLGETKVSIPDSIMPAASLSYEAIVSFFNAENERVVKTATLDFEYKPFPLTITIENDSVVIGKLDASNVATTNATLETTDNDGNNSKKVISIPYKEKVNYFARFYTIYINEDLNTSERKTSEEIDLTNIEDNVQVFASRTSDSLFITTENTRKIPLRYFLFKNKKLIEKGETDNLIFKRKAHSSDNYTLSIQYIWGGQPETREYEIGFDKNNLAISISHPQLVYPGEKTKIDIAVKDAFGNPVKEVDLTAYAITKKFNKQTPPSVPYYPQRKIYRNAFNEFSSKKIEQSASKRIDFDYWKKTIGLDSMLYYHFLFPEQGYFEYRLKADTSQITPFVVSNGGLDPIHVIYVDGQPVYYKEANKHDPYSFAVSVGKHTLTFRIRNRLLTINDVDVKKNEKLILSIDRHSLPAQCKSVEMPYKLTEDEIKKLSRYYILVKSINNNTHAYLKQGLAYRLLSNQNRYYSYNPYEQLVGPFYPGPITYEEKKGDQQTFNYEPFYSYEFKDKQLKLRTLKIETYLNNYFSWSYEEPRLHDKVLTLNDIKEFWKKIEENSIPIEQFSDYVPTSKKVGRVHFGNLPFDTRELTIKASFFVNLNNPDHYFVFTKSMNNVSFEAGKYLAVLVFNNRHYLKIDSLTIKPYGQNYFDLSKYALQVPDSFSVNVIHTISKWSSTPNYVVRNRQLELQRIRELYLKESSSSYSFNHVLKGRIISADDGSPLPGVNVIVKGFTLGTITDENGYYEINCPSNSTLVFSFIGLQTQEKAVNGLSNLDVSLAADVTQLSEVVITGYGINTTKRNLSYAMSSALSGKVAGVTISGQNHALQDSVSLVIRGTASIQQQSEPLVILDGVIVRLTDIDKNKVTAIQVLKSEEAVALYGARAANGVLLFSTKQGATKEYLKQQGKTALTVTALEDVSGNTLRKNFRDYAFWKPNLKTDQHGKASFEATFPDDVTGWKTFVLGVGSKKRTGQAESTIQSYKPIVAQLAQPHFLVKGDSSIALGKITNYNQGEIELERTLTLNNKEVDKSKVVIHDSRIDSIQVHAATTDSLSVLYSVSYQHYTDGELRKIPVYNAGTLESLGEFISLRNDTSITLPFNKALGPVKVFAQADLMDVLIHEIQFLKNYPHECNEQVASTLMALLLERKIMPQSEKNTALEKQIQKKIKKLVANQHENGSWSWWGSAGGSTWVTLHVARCLDFAKKEGFNMPFNKEELMNYLASEVSYSSLHNTLLIFEYLLEQGEKIQVRELADSLQKAPKASMHHKIMAQRLLQLSGVTPNWSWIHSVKSKTVKGNSYWGEDSNGFNHNPILTSLHVYKMMLNENPLQAELNKIQGYFLEKRKKNWRNTYESALILEALLPQLLKDKKELTKPSLTVTTSIPKTIDTFPYEETFNNIETLTISKRGSDPVYLTAYQEIWNEHPERVEKDFVVTTNFEDDKNKLHAGKPTTLVVTLEVKRDVEYVLLEVPIPAGASYDGKPMSRANGEVHREYYYHKTNIYCEHLKKGTYQYKIPILPRYKGKYRINPATAESMYFPTIYGREKLKSVTVD
ncbi:MAG: carboxypeptidase-like regulatory domain-containing protein [Flammeovirgaceae bacterium]|nr:carboxypeptidase-like regulatory domain-containing protein [Flammeovirgaceae bacterium]